MNSKPARRHGSVIAMWVSLLLAVAALTVLEDFWLAAHNVHMLEKDYRSYLRRAGQLLEDGEHIAALEQVREAALLAPERPEPRALKGHIHYELGHWNTAIDSYRRALARGSDANGVRANALWSLIELERYEEAVTLGDRLIAEGAVHPSICRYVAEALIRVDELPRSVPYLEMAFEAYPNDLYIMERLEFAYEATGEREKAGNMAALIEERHAAFGASGE